MITRILVPTDFSEPSLAAVRSGIELAAGVGGVVLLLHVVEGASVRSYAVGGLPLYLSDMIDLGGEYWRSRFDQKLIHPDLCEEARWKLDALIPPRCPARIHAMVTVGRAVDEIVRVAMAQHVDLILLGGRGRRGWRHVFHSTMADRVRRKAPIPVVTLDADDLRVERDPERRGMRDQCLEGGRAVSQRAQLVGVGQDMHGSHRLSRVESTALRVAAHDHPEPPVQPHAPGRDEHSGCPAHQRLPASRV